MLFGVCKGPSYEKAFDALAKMQESVDGVEIRLDLFSKVDALQLKQLLKSWNKKVLLTFRKKSQGGGFGGDVEEQVKVWQQLVLLEPDFIDLEYDAPLSLYQMIKNNYPKIQILCSYHDFEKTPDKIEDVIAVMKKQPADIIKIASQANTSLDALKMMLWVKQSSERGEKVIGLCMGDTGKITRILSPVVGNFMNYASFEQESTAPGQLTTDELFGVYHYGDLQRNTKVFVVIGYPVEKSIGPEIHNAVISKLKRNAVYTKIPIQKEELPAFFDYVKKLSIFGGISVTMPLKEEVLVYLDEIDPEAKTIGAVNTIVFKQGRSIGYNTDGKGAIKALEQKIPLLAKKVIIIGAGGAAKAIVFAAMQKKAHVIVLNRTVQKAQELAAHFQCEAGSLSDLKELARQGYDVIVNTTPDVMPIDEEDIVPSCIAMDIKTQPVLPTFLQKAQSKGCEIVYGWEMFMYQAVEQQGLWFVDAKQTSHTEQIVRGSIIDRLVL